MREENTMVARVTLHNLKLDRDDPICSFGARLRGQASVCKCTGCDANVDYIATILETLCAED